MTNPNLVRQSTNKLEVEVLDEYARMVDLLDQISNSAHELSTLPPYLLENMLPLERKMGLVLTLFKASVWSVLVQKQRESENHLHHH
ncbi:hypothetical protein MJO28_006060 [Puccinia striiformis f. sp. tritici]|uniref:DASH complex subunit DAD3 n=4 Tax=Puccinia striiformis TaxID=27350 RepID=A0A0L0V229_9BASI|nr:hypothetical protein Pst134EA_011287 [Puccinia striiformis f. sp. tritici]KAI9604899.1 hypothetical protein H4Q26_002869 [Puccinia striiformis f. sp. tritici PST-130]KNE93348.1 hypothetical protein PSTG_13290 [Puccinia striiformis f. sp. tritici PST-78]POW11354.1 hypothetical protein PSTT_05337 [Puccinia striiformis]KAH9467651.1 hypothetical protein Pst134EA_011287 [Puccinia striiformis f. sp. tritici]KAI7953513.1 hypothetical protein MJO28_006060 [Puccinia striiformis f. sp. tritici]